MIVVIDSQKLNEDIQKAGYGCTSLAKDCNCSKAHISSILNNKRNPSPKIAVRICELIRGSFENYFFIESVHKKKQKP